MWGVRGGRGAGDPGGGGVPPEDKMAGRGGERGATTTAITASLIHILWRSTFFCFLPCDPFHCIISANATVQIKHNSEHGAASTAGVN